MPLLITFTSKLAFLVIFAYITNILFYNKLLIVVSENIKYYKFPGIIIKFIYQFYRVLIGLIKENRRLQSRFVYKVLVLKFYIILDYKFYFKF